MVPDSETNLGAMGHLSLNLSPWHYWYSGTIFPMREECFVALAGLSIPKERSIMSST